MDIQFGLDISHHQDPALDLARCRREGISFVFLKATEGDDFVDGEFAANLAEARAAGLLVAAYHYLRSTATAAAQVRLIGRVVPRDVPVILDVETGSGTVALVRDIVGRLRQAGFLVPLLYLPRWYWSQLGSPSLAGLPALWSSRYPDRVVGPVAGEWADAPASYWDGYGGLSVAVLQFTSSVAIAGVQPLDANAFRGSAAQLAALLGGTPSEEDTLTPYELGALERASYRINAVMRMAEQIDEPLSETNADGTGARLQETNEVAARITRLERAVAEIHDMLTTLVGGDLQLSATGSITISPQAN